MPEKAADRRTSSGSAPSSSTEKDAALRFLPLTCPRCRFEGKVKITRLDQTFTCKSCQKPFHVMVGGTVPGERPPNAPRVDLSLLATADKPSALERLFARLPRVGQFAALGLLLLAAAHGIACWLEPEKPLPGELEDRAMLAAKSLGQGDWKTLKRLAKSGTGSALGKWYEKVRPAAWKEAGAEPAVSVRLGRISKQPRAFHGAEPLLDARVAAEIQVNGGAKAEIHLNWSQDEHAEWWLDGERMWGESDAAKKPTTGKS